MLLEDGTIFNYHRGNQCKSPQVGARFGEQKNFHYESNGYEAALETKGYL
jgi:hypothetical protein